MKRVLLAAALILVIGAVGFFYWPIPTTDLPPARPLAIVDVTVIDPQSGLRQPGMTVLVEDNRITNVAPTAAFSLPSAVTQVSGTGRFLIPGLWDMHVHGVLADNVRGYVQPLLVASGVTGVRVMDTELTRNDFGQRAEPQWDSSALMPRVIMSGRAVNGPGGAAPTSYVVNSPQDVRVAVDSVAASSAQFVKVFNSISRASYFELLRAARAKGLAVAGHLPFEVTVAEASDSGQASIEHLNGLMRACSGREDELRNALIAVRGQDSAQSVERRLTLNAVQVRDPAVCTALARRLAANGTWITPTLGTLRKRTLSNAPEPVNDSAWSYMPGGRALGKANASWASRQRNQASIDASQLRWRRGLEVVSTLHDAGVGLLAGTDITAPLMIPGFSLHDELSLLVQAGLDPRAALAAATSGPVRYLGLSDSIGSIEPGKSADLVLLAADPLVAIDNTRRISAVILRGRLLDRELLDLILRRTARRARRESLLLDIRLLGSRVWCTAARRSGGACARDVAGPAE